MKTYMFVIALVAIAAVTIPNIAAMSETSDAQRIADLELKVEQQRAVLQEQVNVLLNFSDMQCTPEFESFDTTKFANTGGFNPEWLEYEKVAIEKNCQDAMAMGFEPRYCQYLP